MLQQSNQAVFQFSFSLSQFLFNTCYVPIFFFIWILTSVLFDFLTWLHEYKCAPILTEYFLKFNEPTNLIQSIEIYYYLVVILLLTIKKDANNSVMQKWKHYLEIGLWLQDHKWYFLVVLWTKKCWLIELNLTLSSDMAWLPIDNQPTPYSISIIMKKYQCIVKRLDCKPICKKVYLVIYLLYKKSAVKAIK